MPFLLLCGIPSAGKTTISCQLSIRLKAKVFSFDDFVESQLQPSTSNDTVVVPQYPSISKSPDDDIEDLLKPVKAYRKLWEASIESYLRDLLQNRDFEHHVIILDDNFYLQSQRRSVIKIGKRYGFKICCIKILVEVEEAQRRNEERNLRVSKIPKILLINNGIIQKMDDRFEDSGIDHFFDSSKSEISNLYSFIQIFQESNQEMLCLPLVISPSPSPPPMEHSIMQQLDSLSRKVTNDIISSGYQKHGKLINNFRREVLNQIKIQQNGDTVAMTTETVIKRLMFDKINSFGLNKSC